MNKLDKLREQYDSLKEELNLVAKQKGAIIRKYNSLKESIKIISNTIYSLENKNVVVVKYDPIQKLVRRDVDLIVEFLGKNGKSSPNQIIKHINEQLKGQETRWRGDLENTEWSPRIEPYLMKHEFVEKTKEGRNIFYNLSLVKIR